MRKVEGSCLCGAVSYRASAEPVFVAACHCRDCQKSTGAAHSVNVAVPADALHIEGQMKPFQTTGGSGAAVARMFCPECGSHVLTDAAALPGLSLVQAGTLDDARWARPSMHIWCSSAQPWDQPPADAPCYPQMPQI